MATKTIEYISTKKLACTTCLPSPVIICVDPSRAIKSTCITDISGNPPGTGITDGTGLKKLTGADRPDKSFIKADLVVFVQLKDSCGKPVFRYVLSYDDSQLVGTPNASLSCSDIHGIFCEGCLTDWVESLVGNDVTVEERTAGIITIRNEHGCEFEFRRGWSRLTQNAANGDITVTYPDNTTQVLNIITCAEVPACETPLVANDSSTIDFTNSGVSGHTITGVVKIDPLPNNLITVGANGLRVDCATIANCETPLTPIDTNSVNLTASGTSNHTIQADVIISPTAGNALSLASDGLFVSAAPAGPSDSLVDNGNRTFTHTAVNGAQTIFCQGLQNIVAANDCNGGVGGGAIPDPNGFAIRRADFSGCTLQLEGAPEHTTLAIGGVTAQSLLPTTPLPIGITQDIMRQPLFINNPSNCREFHCVYYHNAYVELEYTIGSQALIETVASQYNMGAAGSPYGSREVHGYPLTAPTIIAAGGNQIIDLYITVRPIAGTVRIWGASQLVGFLASTR